MAVIEAAAKWGIERIGTDSEFAERAFGNHFREIAAKQINRDRVLGVAIDDLQQTPPSSSEEDLAEILDEPFLSRLEQYASGASSDELRERWGRVLAAEVRQPGTFSNQVLRTIDELSGSTAQLFELVCANRLDRVLPKCLMEEVSFSEVLSLTEAGLIVEPGIGQQRNFVAATTGGGNEVWLAQFGAWAISVPTDPPVVNPKPFDEHAVAFAIDGKLGIPIFILTAAGYAISTILQDNTQAAFDQYAEKFCEAFPSTPVTKYRLDDGLFVEISQILSRERREQS